MVKHVVAVLALLPLLVCCDRPQSADENSGWHIRPEHGAYDGSLSYVFGDGEKTSFVAQCNGSPSFMLTGGNYALGAEYFTLVTDDTVWKLHTFQGTEHRGLFVEAAAPATAIANAQRKIEFVVGDWKRQISPGPELARFVRSCS